MLELVERVVELSVASGKEEKAAEPLNQMAAVIRAEETGTETWWWCRSGKGDAAMIQESFRVLADPSEQLRAEIAGSEPTQMPSGGDFRC